MASNNVGMIATATNEDDDMVTDDNMWINNTIRSTKEHFGTTKQHYRSLSRSIIVYGREGIDGDDSTVVRGVYPDAKFN